MKSSNLKSLPNSCFTLYEVYSSSNLLLFWETDVGAGESSRMTESCDSSSITGHLMFVLVSLKRVMMCPVIDNPSRCEIRAVIRFLHAKNIRVTAEEIHRDLCEVYGQNVMREGTVLQWCIVLEDGRNKCSRRRAKWSAGNL